VIGMQLSHFTDIGLRTIMRLAVEDENNSRVTTKLIARQVGASEKHVAKEVSQLVEPGLVQANRGRSGGLFITAAGLGASVGELIRELEGDRDVVECGDRIRVRYSARGGCAEFSVTRRKLCMPNWNAIR
jgi:Rrf2 family nitric oxide-sensitive transcriptional repressor